MPPASRRLRPIWPIAVAEAEQQLNQLLESDDPPFFTALIRQLQAVLAGDRDPALAAYPELSYMGAAELRLLLERLGQDNPEGSLG